MTIDTVRAFLAAHAPDIKILETDPSTAPVEMAAARPGVPPAEHAQTRPPPARPLNDIYRKGN